MTALLIFYAAALAAAVALSGWIRRLWRPRPAPLHIELIHGDITTLAVDAVVNAAKASLMGGGGVDGAIHRAGGPAILAECRKIRAHEYPNGLPVGQAVATTAGHMQARLVIHTVGPVYNPGLDQAHMLRSCYTSALAVADALGVQSIAFPLISSGVYGWPLDDAITQAIAALMLADTSDVKVAKLVLFDEQTYVRALDIARTVKVKVA